VPVSWFRLAAAAAITFVLAYMAFAARLPLERLMPFFRAFADTLFDALPFLLAGSFVSAVLETLVPDRLVQRLAPGGKAGGILFGSLLGIALPICECGMIPVVRRLIRKGLPSFVGVTYMAAGPIVNPVVFASTLTALGVRSDLAYARFALALAVSAVLGFLIAWAMRGRSPLRADRGPGQGGSAFRGHDHGDGLALGGAIELSASAGHPDAHRLRSGMSASRAKLWRDRGAHIVAHAAEDLWDTGKFLIAGCLLTAFLQTALQPDQLAEAAGHNVLPHLFMMGLAFALSLCSTADAFVAASFGHYVPQGALLSFLVFGPMFDLKGMLMMLSVFKGRFVLLFGLLAAWLVLVGSVLVERMGWL